MFKYAALAIAALVSSTEALTVTQRSQMRAQIDEAIDNYLSAQESNENT